MTERRNNKTKNNKKQKLTIMKKIFLVALAAVGLAACATEDTIVTPQGQAIAFGDAFVDNATKAIITSADKITGFQVWGNVKGSNNTPVALYTDAGAAVTRGGAALGAAWTCGVIRYWTPNCDFNFAAIANGTGTDIASGLPTKISYELTADDNDLIYATATANTKGEGYAPSVTDGIVAFTFNHLLSKVTFAVGASAINQNNYSVVVKNIAVTGAVANGTYTVGNAVIDGTWAKTADAATIDQDYYEGSNYVSHLLIPVQQTLGVTVTYDIKFGETTISSDLTKEGSVNYTFATNTAYTITAKLSALNAIQFTVAENNGLGAWTDGSGATIN